MTREAESTDEALEQAVLTSVLTWFSIGGPSVGVLMLVQGLQVGALTWDIIAFVALAALLPVLRALRPRLGYANTARAFLVHLYVMILFAECFRGLTPGIAFGTAAFLLLSALFLGARGAQAALGASLLALGVGGTLSVLGVSRSWDPAFWDPRNPLVWLRYAFVLFFLGGGLVASFIKLLEGLSSRAASLRETLQRERDERAKREQMQDALEQARRMEALAQFAGGLAHDFNNNLMVTMGSVSLLREEPGISPRVAELAEAAASSAEASAELVQQLLSLGRKKASPAHEVQLGHLVDQCRSTLRRVLPPQIKLEIGGDAQLHARLDVAGLQQCLLNLALNARDAMGEGGRFSVRVERREVDRTTAGKDTKPGRYAVICCSDTGCGIEAENLSHLFEPFFTTKGPSKGTGLGLATIQRYVHDAGGFITVESKRGVGTTFALYFPASDALEQRAHAAIAQGA